MTLLFNAIATAVLTLCTLLPLLRTEVWWIRQFDFPRLQLSLLLLGMVGWNTIALDYSGWTAWLLLAASVSCFLYQVWWIVKYTPLYPVEVKTTESADPSRRLRLLTANVLMTNRRADQLLALVRQCDPDVLVTLESDRWWQERLDVLEADYPYTLKCPLDNLYGMHVYSRLTLTHAEITFLVEDDKPSMHASVTLLSGDQVRLHFLHPAPPSPTENDTSSERDAEILTVGRSLADTEEPAIVAGDLNDVAWSETTRTFRKISGLLDPRIGRGMFNTFHADFWFLRWPLDHLFHSRHFTLTQMRKLPSFGSDHFALFTELNLSPGATSQQSGLEADPEAVQRAQEKSEEEGVREEDVPRP